MSLGTKADNKAYYSPSSDGKIVHKITKEEYERRSIDPNDNVRAREWKTKDAEGIAYEEVYRDLIGMIAEISFREHPQYGRSINITLVNSTGDAGVLSVKTDSKYGMSLMELLPNVNLDEEVKITAWAKQDGEKKKQAMFIQQGEGDDGKVVSFYKKWDDKKKAWKLSHGYPEVNEDDKEKFGAKYWSTRYFPEVEVRLVEEIEKKIIPKIKESVPAENGDEITEDDVDF